MDGRELINVIETKRGSTSYSIWTIGITDDPERRRKEHEGERRDVRFWKHRKADGEAIARAVEKHFLEKGMKGDTGGGKVPTFVYVS